MPFHDSVFVYGTLRRGGSNHDLLRSARRLGEHRTQPVFTMLDIGPYPGVVTGGSDAILGEVYRITPAMLRHLDRLEDYPRSYGRERIPTPWGEAWIYLFRPGGGRWARIPGGDWFARR